MPDNPLTKVAPTVLSEANPAPELLLTARQLVQQTAEIRDVFKRSREENWPVGQLAMEIGEPLQSRMGTDDPQEVFQVARYLADEYQQLGDTMLLIDRTTGKAIGRITDEDVWTPAAVPREDGTMAQPLPRLRPELEAFLVMWHFEKARDEQLLAEIAPKLHPTDLLKEQGDPRLLSLTKGGRSQLVDRLRGDLPKLLSMTTGSVGNFLSHFDIRTDDPPKGTPYEPLLRCTAVARSVTGIQDPKTHNLLYNRYGMLCGSVGNSWGREVARTLAVAAKQHFEPQSRPYTTLSPEDMDGITVWVSDPNTLEALVRDVFTIMPYKARQIALPVEHAPTIGVRGRAGAIVVNADSYECQGRELFARWEVASKFEYTLWVDWAEVRAFELTEVPVSGYAMVAAR